MGVGRLAWRTPTGAMLWEIWGRHKLKFVWQGVALAASVFLDHWKEHGAPESLGPPLYIASVFCFLGAYLHLLVCFGYIEVDARRVQLGFPGRLLLKPVSTARLVLVPMVFGGTVIVTIFAIGTELVFRHFVTISLSSLLWISAAQLSLFWWMQALAWSLPLFKVRSLVLLMMVVIHLLVFLMPQIHTSISPGWQWPILAALLVSAVPAAWIGLKLMRQGRWEGPSRISMLWSRLRSTRPQRMRKKFGSALGAQFWLEWRRQGLLLPGFSGGIALLALPCVFIILKKFGEGDPPLGAILSIMLVMPLFLSGVMGTALAKFDPLQSTGELPVYIAARPMTNGGFVMAKLVVALASSALTWLLTVAAAGLCLALDGTGTLFSKAGSVTPYGPVAFMIGCMPVLLLLVIWTWKNLVTGMGVGLTGRPSIDKPDLWIWIALAGFLVLPLADLAIAPLALAWDRHR